MDKIDEVLTRGVEKIFPDRQALEKKLRSGKKIRLYQGFDPTMPNLHLGNMVGLLKLKQFQDLGHEVIFLVGDFTAMIGDPTDKATARKQLTREQVLHNCRLWKEQAGKILRFSGSNPAKMLFNSQWLAKLSFTDLLNLAHHFTFQQTIKRNMFRERLKQNQDIYLHEFLYPLMQAYDSVSMDVDLEIGGSDQMFNMMIGRDLMHKMKNKEKLVLTTKLLIDKEGNKVGKTTGNALFLNASPADFFGGIMSFPDEVIPLAFELLTPLPLQLVKQLEKLHPMESKKRLANEIVKMLFSKKIADSAQNEFETTFQNRQTPGQIPTAKISNRKIKLIDLLVKLQLAKSKSEAKRLTLQKAVEIDGRVFSDIQSDIIVNKGMVIRVGKRKFTRLD